MEMALYIAGIALAFMVVFSILWSAVVYGFSHVSGWQNLAKKFATQPLKEGFYANVTGRVGLSNYNGLLRLAFTQEGMYLHIMPFFQLGHPPLLFPWTKIRHWESKRFFLQTFICCTIDGIQICLPQKYLGTLQSYTSAYS